MTKNKILVIAPHPDDETLGCGGTLLKHKALGDEIYWLIVTNMTDINKWSEEKINKRKLEINKVSKEYNFDEVFNLNIEPTTLDICPIGKIIESMSNIIKKIKPEIIYVNNKNDVHTDHRMVFTAIISSTKFFNNNFIKRILMYECLSETNFNLYTHENIFIPNYYVDISDYLEKKIEIMKIYESEIKSHPFPRSEDSIKSLATLRGSEVGVKYAEGFILLRGIW